jgi:hypothetical protein
MTHDAPTRTDTGTVAVAVAWYGRVASGRPPSRSCVRRGGLGVNGSDVPQPHGRPHRRLHCGLAERSAGSRSTRV